MITERRGGCCERDAGRGSGWWTNLAVWIVSPSLVLGDVTVALCARRSLVCLSQILSALPGTQLTATHRQGHKKHDEHDGYGNYDDNDSCRYGRHGDQ